MEIKICAAQMKIAHLEPETNLEKAIQFAHEAHKQECNILAYPEIFLTGPLTPNYQNLAMEIPNKYTEKFSELAEELNMHIVMGTIYEKQKDKIYNTSILINENGEIIGKYRKNYLWASEKTFATPSKEKPVFDTKYGKIGINICWDLAFPEIAKTMALKGAKIIITPSFWTQEDKYGWQIDQETAKQIPQHDTEALFIDTVVPARAIENEVIYVYINGAETFQHKNGYTLHFFGHTQIATPLYGTIKKLNQKENLLTAKTNTNITQTAEKIYQIKQDTLKRTTINQWENL